MKARVDEKSQLNHSPNSTFTRRGCYFHPDEDFREDWDWGKTKQVKEQPVHEPQVKKIIILP
ncbi:hypothetical protein [Pedobacter sp. NJ-S-72]